MGFSILLRLFIRSNEIRNTNYASLCIHAQNSIFKDITMCQMILKEMKYNLHQTLISLCAEKWKSYRSSSLGVIMCLAYFIKLFLVRSVSPSQDYPSPLSNVVKRVKLQIFAKKR